MPLFEFDEISLLQSVVIAFFLGFFKNVNTKKEDDKTFTELIIHGVFFAIIRMLVLLSEAYIITIFI